MDFFTLHTIGDRLLPAMEITLKADDIYCNDVTLPFDFNPHNIGLYVVLNEYGSMFAIWSHDHDCLDVAVDLNLLDSCIAENQDYEDESLTSLGNADELFDLDNINYARIDLQCERDFKLLKKFIIANERQENTLNFYE